MTADRDPRTSGEPDEGDVASLTDRDLLARIGVPSSQYPGTDDYLGYPVADAVLAALPGLGWVKGDTARVTYEGSPGQHADRYADDDEHRRDCPICKDVGQEPQAVAWALSEFGAHDLWDDLFWTRGDAENAARQRQAGLVVLRELVALKDGPRDDDYERRKPLAWAAARAALAATRPDETRDET